MYCTLQRTNPELFLLELSTSAIFKQSTYNALLNVVLVDMYQFDPPLPFVITELIFLSTTKYSLFENLIIFLFVHKHYLSLKVGSN